MLYLAKIQNAKPPLILLCCLIISACCDQRILPKHDVKLSISPSTTTFAYKQPVKLHLTFENKGNEKINISTMTDGNLWAISLTRDGVPVVARETYVRYRNGLKMLISKKFSSLAPGGTVSTVWTSNMDTQQQAQSLQFVRFDPEGYHAAALYNVGQPGNYTMTIIYRHGNPWAQPLDVFVGETNEATVSFSVM